MQSTPTRAEMEDAGLSVGLMYGNGGGQAASTAGGTATQPNAPKTNPVEVALQQQSLGLQLKQIEAQNKLANAETAKTKIPRHDRHFRRYVLGGKVQKSYSVTDIIA